MDDKEFSKDFEINEDNNSTNTEQDDFVIGQGFTVSEYEEASEPVAKKKSGRKSGGTFKSLAWILCIVVLSVGIAFGVIYAGADYLGIGFGRGVDCQMNIEMGSSTKAISNELKECGAVKIPLLFRLYSRLNGYDSQYKYGLYTFNNELGYGEIATMLITEGAKAESIRVTIPEGTGINDYTKNVNGEKVTVKGITTILEEAGVCTREDFLAALKTVSFDTELLKNAQIEKTYYKLEGYLFPETYEFFAYDSAECAELVVKKMIAETESRITDAMYKRAREMGYTINEIITMASIIQMESGQTVKAMPDVAAVFYNRLRSEDFATLGSSPTCYYGNSFKSDDGRYDTYKAKGLPPGPLCSPGIDAIKAALYPSDNDYYYFVTDKNSKFYFHKTMAEQNKTIAKLQQGDNWVYEYFD
ncbi:MAG: endolytic transglycosylase MltG [Ruminococcaceae bacterium]|nr:endolytic transglycosylase MltG [Oscillospiraceae bacterium]